MTIDRSLRVRKGMLSNRNVLKRAERLEKLKETERWQESDSIFGLPKVKIQKVAVKRKKKPTASSKPYCRFPAIGLHQEGLLRKYTCTAHYWTVVVWAVYTGLSMSKKIS